MNVGFEAVAILEFSVKHTRHIIFMLSLFHSAHTFTVRTHDIYQHTHRILQLSTFKCSDDVIEMNQSRYVEKV